MKDLLSILLLDELHKPFTFHFAWAGPGPRNPVDDVSVLSSVLAASAGTSDSDVRITSAAASRTALLRGSLGLCCSTSPRA